MSIDVLDSERQLIEKNVDLAISEGITKSSHIEYEPICTIEMPMVVSTQHKIADLKGEIPESQILNYPQIIVKSTGPAEVGDAGILKGASRWTVSNFLAKKTLLLQGIGWGRMPDHLVKEEIDRGALKILDVQYQNQTSVTLYKARRKHDNYGKISQYLWEQLSGLSVLE